jgi:murein L,D-transpeptidase YcbB/YkuD
MLRLLPRVAPLTCLLTGLAALASGCGINPAAGTYEGPPAVSAPPSRNSPAAPPSATDVRGAVQSLLEAERHPLLKWPDITQHVPTLAAAAADEPDGLFWFVDGASHPSLEGALQALARAEVHGLDPADFDAAPLGVRWHQIQGAKAPQAGDLAAFDTAVSVSVLRFLSSVHEGRVDPRLVGFDYDVSGKRLDPLASLRSARDEAVGPAAAVERARPPFPVYYRLMTALAAYRAAVAAGEPPAVPALRAAEKKVTPGQPWEGAVALAARLTAVGDLPAAAPVPEAAAGVPVYGGALVDAVKRFQSRHALDSDGVIGLSTIKALNVPLASRVRQIELAMERERWLPDLAGRPYLLVNVPLFRMWAFDPSVAGEPLLMNVVVGRSVGYSTPIFIGEMAYIVFRPYWNPPPGILRAEIIPHARRDPGYLASEDMEIIAADSDGGAPLPATPENLDKVLAGTLVLRQRPGPKNSLGPAKFIFPNDENVYMHGTPAQKLFSRARRDFSHGCIRVEDPVSLAEWALREGPVWTRERILAAMSGATPVQVNLKRKLTVVICYDTAYVDSKGVVHFADDYYGHDAKLVEALAHGFPYPRSS